MTLLEQFPGLRPGDISFDSDSLIVKEVLIPSTNPRMSFISALAEFENEENNTFETTTTGTKIQLDTIIGDDVKIGCNCVIGGHGFGYEPDEELTLIRMPHLGNVVIHDHVTIHNLVNIDRAVLGSTVIGYGTKIDSHTHVAHGVHIGKHCAIIGAGIGGSVIIGDHCYIGFRSLIKQKVRIGHNAKIGMGAIILKDVPDNHPDWIVGIWKG
jgi:UDP-3-O-[3-hydroxymyristoyl] glucosamine N-acyltransferase